MAVTEKELIVERDAALALAERHRRALLNIAHDCEEGRISLREIAARARAEIRVKGE